MKFETGAFYDSKEVFIKVQGDYQADLMNRWKKAIKSATDAFDRLGKAMKGLADELDEESK